MLGCKKISWPTSCLGLPLGERSLSKTKWDKIVEKCSSRLAPWKKKLLSKSGKLTLIWSFIQSLPLYFFSVLLAPYSVSRKLDKIVRDFLWHKDKDQKHYHLVSWKVVSRSKESGGLGLTVAHLINKALLEKNNLWCIIVKEKYGELDFERGTRKPKGPQGVNVWHNIYKTLGVFKR